MIKCVVIDDEVPARKLISSFLTTLPDFEVMESFDNAKDGFVYLQQNEVDLLFLDVQMPRMTGIELLKSLNKKPCVILTTAFRDYAVEGFDLEVFDYLVKPISQDRFLKSISRYLQSKPAAIEPLATNDVEEKISLKVGKEIKLLDPHSIYLIEGLKDYIKVHTATGIYVVYERMSTMESILPKNIFSRIHKSYIISKDHISHRSHNQLTVAGHKVPIGRTYRNEFIEKNKNAQHDQEISSSH
ncbi:LytR/AlgR family response regulator transcription factor [Aquirufa sp. ROCK-SH2]